jgi:aryl-alcohol dehydrogenase-like predicted oxidoreductase
METRRLGALEVPAIGLGCMGMSVAYGTRDDAGSEATILHALDRGVTLLDTADVYGGGHNEALVGRALKGRRDRAILATKFGNVPGAGPGGRPWTVCGRPDYVRAACAASLSRLGVETIDLYYLHRADPDVPIEETVGAMAGLVAEGKVRHLGLSEVSAETLERAHATHPVAALQSEYSLWTRDMEARILPLCRRLGIGFVAYSPLGRGFLSGTIGADTLGEGDRRRAHPRFSPGNIERNVALLDPLRAAGARLGATPAQVALAWLLAKGPDIVPIPGTKRIRWLDENIAATDLRLTEAEIAALDAAFPPDAAQGMRYPEADMVKLGR